MTDVQIFTIALAISTSFLAVFLGVLLNNNRLNDVKDVMTSKVEANGAAVRLLIEERQSGMSRVVSDLRVLIEKNHSAMMVRLTDIEGRITRIENERRIV